MTGALVGLIGVVAGALLGGVIDAVLERRRRRAAAAAAGWLIAAELQDAATRIGGALEDKEWWLGELPTDAWKAHVNDLAYAMRLLDPGRPSAAAARGTPGSAAETEAKPAATAGTGAVGAREPDDNRRADGATGDTPVGKTVDPLYAQKRPQGDGEPNLLLRLADAYAIVDRCNALRASSEAVWGVEDEPQIHDREHVPRWLLILADALRARTSEAAPAPRVGPVPELDPSNEETAARKLRAELEQSRQLIESASQFLSGLLWSPPGAGLRYATRIPAVLALVAIGVALVYSALVPRVHLTDRTVASTLHAELADRLDVPRSELEVDCDPDKGDWRCTVRSFEQMDDVCPRPSATSGPVPRGRTQFASTAGFARTTCEDDRATFEGRRDGEVLSYTPEIVSVSSELARRAGRINAPGAKENLFDKLKRLLGGGSL